jgi:hypothetical protein
MSRGRRARLRTTGALLLSAFTAHACADAEPIDPAAVAPATRDLPRERVEARFPGKTVGIAAEVELGDLRAAIVWPMLEGGGFVDDEIVAIAFARDGRRGRWRPHGEAITLSTKGGRDALRGLLGGEALVVDRRCGLEKESLAAHLNDQLAAFKAAHARGDAPAAVLAYEELARAFSFELIAYDDVLPEWLIAATTDGGITLDLRPGDNGEWYAAEIQLGDQVERGRVPLVRCGDGWVLGKPLD